MISTQNVSLQYGDRALFENVSVMESSVLMELVKVLF
mgnify:CR=1 FL=1